ncbi:nuclease-related domain-containing protein [Shewanella sp. JL219SE-S6]
MAKHISFGTPVNDAERWAFELLGDELPKDYLLLTNIEIPTQSGQAMEVDALVVGEWGVYVIDVKGYIGRLNAGLHAWSLDGREVDNSLSKANYVARVLAGKLKNKIPVGVYAPWCQGMVFVTGHKGEAIELEKQDGALSIYTPRQIIAALTKEWGLTAPHKHQINQRQKEAVLDTLGQVALVEQRNNKIQDFIKLKCLFLQSGLEVWQAEYNPGGWTAPWLLKILIPTHFEQLSEARQHEEQLRGSFNGYRNCPVAAACLTLRPLFRMASSWCCLFACQEVCLFICWKSSGSASINCWRYCAAGPPVCRKFIGVISVSVAGMSTACLSVMMAKSSLSISVMTSVSTRISGAMLSDSCPWRWPLISHVSISGSSESRQGGARILMSLEPTSARLSKPESVTAWIVIQR